MKKQILLLLSLALAKTYSAESGLFGAIEENNVDLVAQLLTLGASANVFNDIGDSPLHLAASICSDTAIPTLLLQHGADIEAKDFQDNRPLHCALEYNTIEITKLLLDNSADINAKNKDGYTPLMFAIFGKHHNISTVTLIIEKGAHLDNQDSQGETALHKAVVHNDPAAIQLLLDKGADSDKKCSDNRTPLYLALKECDLGNPKENTAAINILLAWENKKGYKDGNTPLHITALHNFTKETRILLALNRVSDLPQKGLVNPIL